MKKILSLVLSFMVIFGSTLVVSASSYLDNSLDNSFKNFKKAHVIKDGKDRIIIPNKDVKDKKQYMKDLDSIFDSAKENSVSTVTFDLYDIDSEEYSDGDVYSSFDSTIENTGAFETVMNGRASAVWTGNDPFNVSVKTSVSRSKG